jgi:hypothetical protein
LFGYRTEWSPPEDCDIYGAGSVLGWATSNQGFVWGSGFMFEKDKVNVNLTYCVVRGDLSKKRLDIKYQNLPTGDPGLLASIVYPRSRTKNQKIGVVPHFIDTDNKIFKRFANDSRFMLIDAAAPPNVVAKKVSSCKLVLSSSLHGLIFADAYGIPNIHIEVSDKVAGDGYKFKDYYSGIKKKYTKADIKKIFNDDYLETITASYCTIKDLRKIQRSLIRAFPF